MEPGTDGYQRSGVWQAPGASVARVIKTEAENERMIAELERLDTRGEALTPEEESLAELITTLVRQFDFGTPV